MYERCGLFEGFTNWLWFVEKLTLNCNAALDVYEEGEVVGIAEFGWIGIEKLINFFFSEKLTLNCNAEFKSCCDVI